MTGLSLIGCMNIYSLGLKEISPGLLSLSRGVLSLLAKNSKVIRFEKFLTVKKKI